MTEQICTKTMQEVLKQEIINKKGYFKLNLFSKSNENNKNKYSLFRFKYITPYPDNIAPINSINNFNLDNIRHFCYIDNTFEDLKKFYKLVGYTNINELLKKDFCVRIKELLIDIYNNIILLNKEDFDLFIKELKMYFINMVKDYYEGKVCSKESSAPFETCIKNSLSVEEQKEYDKMIENAIKDTSKQIKNSELGNIFK